MKYFYLLILCFGLYACGGGDSLPAPERDAVVNAASADAQEVIEAPEASMQQQNAILAIRAKETELRMSGFDKAADLYEQTACSILVQNQILNPQCLNITPK